MSAHAIAPPSLFDTLSISLVTHIKLFSTGQAECCGASIRAENRMCAAIGAAPCILGGSADPQLQALFLIEHGLHHHNTDDWYNQVAVAASRAPGWDAHYWGPNFVGWNSTKTFSANVEHHFPDTRFEVVFMHWSLESDLVREAQRDHHLDAVLRTLPGAPLLATIEHEMAEQEFTRY
jgi:hypothetical protein